MNPLSIFLIIVGSLLGLVILLLSLWYLARYILQFIVAKYQDGSYIYDKNDFKEDGKTPIDRNLSVQNNVIEFNFDDTTLHYNVRFGDKRALKYGIIRVHHGDQWYSSHPISDEKKLLFQQRKDEDLTHVEFSTLKGESHTTSIEWTLEGISIRVITHFNVFNDGSLSVEEPDLKYISTTINNLNFIVFSIEFPDGLEECSTNKFTDPCIHFPQFFNDSPNRRILSFKNQKFAPSTQKLIPSSGPVTLFDENLNTLVISSLDQFVTHITQMEGTNMRVSEFQCGLNGEITDIPKNHESHFIISFDKGINNSLNRLGDILRSYHNSPRRSMSMDNFTTYLGYWTDNGAKYYYKPLKNLSLSETLILVDKYAENMGIPLCNYNLDSWWYKKDVKKWIRTVLGPFGRIIGGSLYGGTVEWDIDPFFMHTSFMEFKKQIKKPLNAHGRWFSNKTVYKKDFPFITEGNKSLCIESDFWDMLMKQCQEYGIDNYEQDWMSVTFNSFKFLRNTVGNTKKWLTSMGNAAEKYGRTIEYCMTTSGMFLSSLYPETTSVSFVRTCDDYNPHWPRNWDYKHFVQTNILAYAVRAWPFKDVFMSSGKGSFLSREKQPELMALTSALSCGPVGPGDKIDEFGIENLFRTCRKDGYLIKPDKPLTAADSMYVPHSKYFVSGSYSDHHEYRWWYIIQNKLTASQPKDPYLYPKDFGMVKSDIEAIAFNYFNGRMRKFSNINPINTYLKGFDYNYWIIAPIFVEGFALIGDISKYATMSYQLIQDVQWKKYELKLTLKSISGEPLHLQFYDDERIKSIQVDGENLKRESLRWVYDKNKNSSLIFHEFTKDTCEIVVKVKK